MADSAASGQAQHFDIVVIGGGPGGYVAAIRAAQLGFRTAVVERNKLGGVCLNWGCIPTKALLANAELVEKLQKAEEWGLKLEGGFSYDWSKTIGRSREAASKLNRGVAGLMRKNKITHIEGSAKIVAAGSPVKIEVSESKTQEELTHAPTEIGGVQQTITCDHCIVSTGSVARDLPFARFDGKRIWGAREAMNNTERPERLIVIGAGAIGIEFAYFYHTMGSKVTVIEMLDRILPVEDGEISRGLEKIYRKHGIDIRTGHTTMAVDTSDTGVRVTVAPVGADRKPDESKKEVLEADRVLLAIGVKGRFDGLFDDSLGLEVVKDHIATDYKPGQTVNQAIDYRTSLENVYAIGDVIGPPWLAHVASEEGVICVERIAWRAGKLDHEPISIDYSVIPGCTYCHPQVASVGFTEERLKADGLERGKDYEVGTFPFQANGRAIAQMATDGLVKVIRGLPRGEILGAHILGESATELISEFTTARRLEATTEEIIATVHAHPTLHEALHEAALASEGRVIHF